MDQVTPEPPPAACPTCEQVATAISSLMSQKPDNFVFAPNELLSGQILYDRVDDVNTYDFDAGLDYSESSTCTTCKALVQRITDTKLWKEDPEPISTLASLKITLSGPMCQRDCFMLDVSGHNNFFLVDVHRAIDSLSYEKISATDRPLYFRQAFLTPGLTCRLQHSSVLGSDLRHSACGKMPFLQHRTTLLSS